MAPQLLALGLEFLCIYLHTLRCQQMRGKIKKMNSSQPGNLKIQNPKSFAICDKLGPWFRAQSIAISLLTRAGGRRSGAVGRLAPGGPARFKPIAGRARPVRAYNRAGPPAKVWRVTARSRLGFFS